MLGVLLTLMLVTGLIAVLGIGMIAGGLGAAGIFFGGILLLVGLYMNIKTWKIFFWELNR